MKNPSQLTVFLKYALATALLTLCPACVSSTTTGGQGASMEVQVATIQNITVQGEPVRFSDLPGRLKSLGASRKTRIMLVVAADAPRGTDEKVQEALVRGGFPKVVRVLKHPPRAYAGKQKSQPTASAPPPPAAPLKKK